MEVSAESFYLSGISGIIAGGCVWESISGVMLIASRQV